MKVLLGAALVLILIYVIAGESITAVTNLSNNPEDTTGTKVGYAPFQTTFKEQYICYSFETDRWVATPGREHDVCKGPFIDSGNLCAALKNEGQHSVQLYHEGRTLTCD